MTTPRNTVQPCCRSQAMSYGANVNKSMATRKTSKPPESAVSSMPWIEEREKASSVIMKTIWDWQNGQIAYDVLETTIKNIVNRLPNKGSSSREVVPALVSRPVRRRRCPDCQGKGYHESMWTDWMRVTCTGCKDTGRGISEREAPANDPKLGAGV